MLLLLLGELLGLNFITLQPKLERQDILSAFMAKSDIVVVVIVVFAVVEETNYNEKVFLLKITYHKWVFIKLILESGRLLVLLEQYMRPNGAPTSLIHLENASV